MDPTTITGLTALFAIVRDFGPLGGIGILLFFLARAWRGGEFLSKAVHDEIVEATRTRYLDMLERYKASQDGLLAWRQSAERATEAAEASQAQHTTILARLDELDREVDELRAILRERGGAFPERGGDREYRRGGSGGDERDVRDAPPPRQQRAARARAPYAQRQTPAAGT